MANRPDTNFLSGTSIPGPYKTALPLSQELEFQQWVKKNKIPFKDSVNNDYDMRGYWKALQNADPAAVRALGNNHFPDTYKTPYHETFSNESKYATPNAPKWQGDKLVDILGTILKDETPK